MHVVLANVINFEGFHRLIQVLNKPQVAQVVARHVQITVEHEHSMTLQKPVGLIKSSVFHNSNPQTDCVENFVVLCADVTVLTVVVGTHGVARREITTLREISMRSHATRACLETVRTCRLPTAARTRARAALHALPDC